MFHIWEMFLKLCNLLTNCQPAVAESHFDINYCLSCQTTKLVTDFVKCEMIVCVAIIQEHNLLCRLEGCYDDTYLGTVEVAKAVGVFLRSMCHLRKLK